VDSELGAGVENLSLSGRVFMTDGFVEVTPRTTPTTRVQLIETSTGLENGGVIMLGATTQASVIYNGGSNPPNVTIAPR